MPELLPPRGEKLPWQSGEIPLMLAPMQGVTNRALRSLFIEWVRPDLVFTEFMRVSPVAREKRLSANDLGEIAPTEQGVPLVVQLIGHGLEPLVAAARAAEQAGAAHLNLNLGCPYGRMTSGATGGKMLRQPEELAGLLPPLRREIKGSFSVKLRAGYDDPRQIFSLLPLLEEAGVDFLVLHPRTVVQEYAGWADHEITGQVVRETRLPVIANGDIRTAAAAWRLLEETGAAGLMLGRGAIADPLLFQRIRGKAPADPDREERARELQRYLQEAASRYRGLFCGEVQVLGKLKALLTPMEDPELAKEFKQLRKSGSLDQFLCRVEKLG